MSYLNKYQKYKKKYLNLLNEINQLGGEPNTLILKNLNLFTNREHHMNEVEKYLNPIYGYILYKSDFLKNCIKYKTMHNYNTPMSNFVTDCFNLIETQINIKPNILKNIKPEDIAFFAGYWFMYFKEIYNYDTNLKDIDKMLKLVKEYIRNKYEFIPKSNRHNVCENLYEKIQLIFNFIYEYNIPIEIDVSDPQKSLNEVLSHLNVMKKENSDIRSQKITEFNNKYSKISADEKINKIFNENFKYLNKDAIYPQMFHVLLAILWRVSKNKKDYKKYYETLNLILPSEYQVIIPEGYETNNFIESEIYNDYTELNKENVFFRELVKMTEISEITIEKYDYVIINGLSEPYADCAETTIRNFIKILTFDTETKNFSLEKLNLLGAVPNVIEYFTVYNTDDIHTSGNKLTFKGEKQDARIAWDTIISNLPNIRYKKEENGYKYEIKNGHGLRRDENNLLCVLKEIFTEINDWSDFVKKGLVSSMTVVLNEKFSGTITFDIYDINLIVSEYGGHSDITKKIDTKFINRKKILPKYRIYFDILTNNIDFEKYSYIDNWMLFVLYDNIFYLANYLYTKNITDSDTNYDYEYKLDIDTKLYSALIDNITKNNTNEELVRLYVLYKYVSKANIKVCNQYLNNYSPFINLEYLYLSYHDLYSSTDDNITENNIFFNFDSIKNNYKLRNIKLFDLEFTEPIGTSLSKLTNLEILHLYGYNYQLNDSLNNLANLTELESDYNLPIGDSFINLTNLTFLNLYKYDKALNNSLETLTKLTSIDLTDYNQSLGVSLNNLTNLTFLGLYKYDKPLNYSLINLTNLKNLHLTKYNQPLNNSLETLTNLTSLDLNDYNQPLGISLNNLTGLQILTLNNYTPPLKNDLDNLTNLSMLSLNSYNLPLFDSLDKLVNLSDIYLGSYDKDIPSSLNKLTNLKNLNLNSYIENNEYIYDLFHTPGIRVVLHPLNEINI